jgi:hypothetical protein
MSSVRVGGPSERLVPLVAPKGDAPEAVARTHLAEGGPSPFAQVLRGLGHEITQGEATMHGALAAAGNTKLGTGELIALQASVYRYSEAIDLGSRLVDHATSGLKTILQGSQ